MGQGYTGDSSDSSETAHDYESTNKVCSFSNSACTIDNVKPIFSVFSYPGADGTQPVYSGDIRYAGMGWLLGGFVTQDVDESGTSVMNTTTFVHFLYPGYVVRTLYAGQDGIYVNTIGIGWTPAGTVNSLVGTKIVWPSLDSAISGTFCAKYGKC